MRAILLLIVALAVAGCGAKHSIVGEWETRTEIGVGSMIFRDDCTFRSFRDAPMASLLLNGTYEYKDGTLKLHIVKWGIPHGPELSTADRDAMNKAFRIDSISTVTWSDDDHIRLSAADGQLTTASRVKK